MGFKVVAVTGLQFWVLFWIHRQAPDFQRNRELLNTYGYRDYDPQTGRWTGRDPIDEVGGPLWFDKIEKYTKTRREFDDELIELMVVPILFCKFERC